MRIVSMQVTTPVPHCPAANTCIKSFHPLKPNPKSQKAPLRMVSQLP